MAKAILCLLLSALLVRVSVGMSLPQCFDGSIELTEGVAGQTITCTGTGSTHQVTWRFNNVGLATCSVPSTCSSQFTFVSPTRNDSSSTLTFPGATSRSLLGNTIITCQLAGTSQQNRSCTVDVVYAAEKPTCSISSKRDNSELKLIGVCTINKAFSSIGSYDCQWIHRNITGQITPIPEDKTLVTSPVMIPGTGNDPYYSFNCSFEVTLPLEAGRHSYKVLVKPGSVLTTTTYDIAIPSLQHDCSTDYLRVGSSVTCTCSAVTPGSEVADISWENTNSNQLPLTLTSQHNNRQFTCQAKWGTIVVNMTTFTPKVAYGPGNVTVTGPPKPLDTNGQTSMTLTCTPSDSNPSEPNFAWHPLPETPVGTNQRTITLKASQDIDEKQIQCNASNSQFSDISAVGTYTVSLNCARGST